MNRENTKMGIFSDNNLIYLIENTHYRIVFLTHCFLSIWLPASTICNRAHLATGTMESEQLSLLSSLKGELQSEDYIHPHYKEAYRLAIDSLVNCGRESYQEFLKAERIGSFLSEDELHFITTNASQPLPSSHTEETNGPALDTPASKSSTGTYWPVHSDIVTPDLELGWPMVMHDKHQTNIDLLFHPPRLNSPTIKEVIRKQIQDARQVL